MTITCPKCRRADQIQKVSAIYANGTSNSSHTGRANGFGYSLDGELVAVTGSATTYGSSQTMLAARLAPPSPPQGTRWFWYVLPFLLFHFTLIFVWFAPMSKTYRLLLLGLGAASFFVITPILSTRLGRTIDSLILLVMFAVYYFGLFHQIYTRRSKLIPLWHKQMAEWNLLYYCSRDDCTFIPRG